MTKATYTFDNTWQQARQRLAGIEARYDAGTIRHLEACGIDGGWHCLEVGGGGGSIAAWLCQRVGPAGHVTATDLDTRFLDALHAPTLDVRQHDLAADALPPGTFDLVHARMLLSHLSRREQALQKLVAALKPGGWLVVEEMDGVSTALVAPTDAASQDLYRRVEGAVSVAMAAHGHSYDYGRRLYGAFLDHGLDEVHAEGRVYLRSAGAGAMVARLTVAQLQSELLADGAVTEADLAAYFVLLEDPTFVAVSPMLMAVRGRRLMHPKG